MKLDRMLLVAGLGLLAVGCKKSIPEPWKEYGFPTDGLQQIREATPERLDLDYKPKVPALATLQAMGLLSDYGTKIKAKGFTQSCTGEFRYSFGDRAFLDGYTNGTDRLGIITTFDDKGKLEMTVTKAFDKDRIFGAVFKSSCKPMK